MSWKVLLVSLSMGFSLGVTPALAAKPVCGDGRVRGGEECDGTDLAGQTCARLGYASGALACASDCTFDTAACSTGSECGDGVVEDYEECDGASDSACPGVCSSHCACPSMAPGDLEVHMMDVGQGDALVLISPDGFVMLVDSGEESEATAVAAYLSGLGVTEVDYTLVSHLHSDHMGAMDVLLGQHPEVVVSFDHGGTYSTNEYTEYDTAAGTRRTALLQGETVDMGPSMTVDVLHSGGGSSNENNDSVVLKATYGATSFLLGGDCEASCENSLTTGEIDVYKVHHHGSVTGSTDALLDQMLAETALISVGEFNSYGHPDPAIIAKFSDYSTTVYRTDLDGDIEVIANGAGYTVNGAATCTTGETRTCGTSNVGACSYGVSECTAGVWGDCVGGVDPVAELCDSGVDDDCDGFTDSADSECISSSYEVVISQVGYDTPGDDALEEFVDLYNPGASATSLDGWSLTDNATTWTFPAGTTIGAGEWLSVARNGAGFAALYGLDADVSGLTTALGNTGDSLILADDLGAEVDFVAWEDAVVGWSITAPIGDSIERSDPGTDTDSASDFSVTSPAAPQGGVFSACGDGTCGLDEDCTSCPSDCDGVTGGKPSKRYCCGNGTCETVGEDATTCAIDCL
jgi:beta-lactamase superfamily II metal-dependent hydrolase